ncbi:nicotinate (nicotinamide) nucleotide adenylyltransferase [Mucisphaera sp.]|uniref:nicotinate (nicotinamide) nucleotide adenylyltransferase n=1 Tax=Mucisphaera sp. TaxID=2913024 RepID=UPI003D0B72CF
MYHRTILIFGGTFDPPHQAHIDLPEQARQAVDADQILYLPAGTPPHKRHQTISPSHHRLAMLRLALRHQPHAVIDPREIDAPEDHPNYTVTTLEALRSEHPKTTRLHLLIGSDQAAVFDTWRDPQRIQQLAPPLVMIRPPLTAETFLNSLPPHERGQWANSLVPVQTTDTSATDIREAISRGQPIPATVPPDVRDYITMNNLYR